MKMSNILIQNATMVLPNTTVVGDLLIEDGTITAIQPGGGLIAKEGIESIDATGLHLLPGIIDPTGPFPRSRSTRERRLVHRLLCCC